MKKVSRFLAGAVLIACGLITTGCSTGGTTRSQKEPDLSFWQPHLLYVLAAPHPRLYVEIDAVQGCAPSDAALNKLREFLTTYCNKPGGVQVVRSDVIPTAAARGTAPIELVRKYFNGPPEDPNGSSPAFMYVLYYSGALSDKRPAAGPAQPGEKTAPRPLRKAVHPHADLIPYPAIIFMNTSYMTSWGRGEVLMHEAGHLLGLAVRPTYARDYHCLGPTCLMNRCFYPGRFLIGWQKRLCRKCMAQMADSSTLSVPVNLHFVGPVLVRSERDYHVMSLPQRVRIVLGDMTEQDCRDFTTAALTETLSADDTDDTVTFDALIKDDVLNDPAKMRDIINRIKRDRYETLRTAAEDIWKEPEPAPAP